MEQKRVQAIAFIRADPWRALRLIAARSALFWFPYTGRPAQMLLFASLTLVAWSGFARLCRTGPESTVRAVASLWLFFPAIYYIVYTEPRYRLPIHWTFLLMAAWGVMGVLNRIRFRMASRLLSTRHNKPDDDEHEASVHRIMERIERARRLELMAAFRARGSAS